MTIKGFKKDGLYFIPLGGSEQFGVNLNVYISGGKILAVDCGLGFADERFPGIDLLLPDISFLEDNRDNLSGLIITHAHEDHIGAVAHLYEYLRCPLYASPFTAAVLRRKLGDASVKGAKIHEVAPMEHIKIGPFSTQFVPVAHSIPDACALIIETGQGRVVHSGDWNLDPAPVTGNPTNPKPFKDAGKKGVLAYIGDSTNAEVPGMSGSEADVAKGLEAEFKRCKSRIIVTMFSSNIGRMISIARAAAACGRTVGVVGRSLHRMAGIARECGYMDDVPDFADEEELGMLPDENVVMIMTGSQGEYRAALPKIARGDHRHVNLKRGDTVIFSAREIPGNELAINEVKNNLSAAGAHIITPRDTEHVIHVSGHPCQDEITQMYQWVQPDTVIPVHGERTQLDAQARLARASQIKNVIVPVNGAVIELTPGATKTVDHIETGLLAVDQNRLIPDSHDSIRQRRKLQYTGVVHVSVVLDKNGKVKGKPMLDTVGLFDPDDEADQEIEDNLFDEITELFHELTPEERRDAHFVSEELRIGLRRFVHNTLGLRPKVTVHVMGG